MPSALFADRAAAGRALAAALEPERTRQPVVVGLARGGVVVAAEVARVLSAPLDALAVRKVGHPGQPEYALGAVTPTGGYLRADGELGDAQLAALVEETTRKAAALDRRLHARDPSVDLHARTALLVDDGLATGATMVAAARSARAAGATRVVIAVPVAPASSAAALRREADDVVVLASPEPFCSVGTWYATFPQVDDATVIAALAHQSRRTPK